MLNKTILEQVDTLEDQDYYISQALEEIFNYKIQRMKVDDEYKKNEYKTDVIESFLEIVDYIKKG